MNVPAHVTCYMSREIRSIGRSVSDRMDSARFYWQEDASICSYLPKFVLIPYHTRCDAGCSVYIDQTNGSYQRLGKLRITSITRGMEKLLNLARFQCFATSTSGRGGSVLRSFETIGGSTEGFETTHRKA